MQYQENQKSPDSNMVRYNGHLIQAASYQLKDSGEWTINLTIYRDMGNIKGKQFSAANTLKIKAEAISHCIEFGKLIIDGKYENYSLEDL
jgi:hypothetical protein